MNSTRTLVKAFTSPCGLNYTQARTSFFNRYKHGPHKSMNPQPDYLKWTKEFFGKEGLEFIKTESNRIIRKPFRSHFKPKVKMDTTNIFEHFDSDAAVARWKPVADSDSNNGFSTSSLIRSPKGHGLFKGVLDTRLPDDGLTMKSGFAGVIGPYAERDSIFATETHWDWSYYNTFEIRFRGDGRKYNVVLNTSTWDHDLAFYDAHGFPLYTRGGPYWQTYRIPFSKFIFIYKGFIQDMQSGLTSFRIRFVALTLEDQVDGPFGLEVDYMGLRLEHTPFNEDCAYETYEFPHIKYKPVHVDCEAPIG